MRSGAEPRAAGNAVVPSASVDEITAAILAGGEGRRVDGCDKGLLALAGRPLVAQVAEALRAHVATILICANRHAADYALFGRVVPDATSGFRGPLAGIAAALAQCATPWLLTVPVDGPNVPRELAHRLHRAADAAGADVAVAHDGVRREPLFALYRNSLAVSAAQALQQNLAVYRWQDTLGAVEVDFADVPHAFINLNTLDEFQRWEQQHAD
jgi:molybdopterin-guanine dinucleotide biosynthesis protein A